MPNLVKQRFVVENQKNIRVIDSNEKIVKIIGQRNPEDGFIQGLSAEQLDVDYDENTLDENNEDEIFGLYELTADKEEDSFIEEEVIPQETTKEELMQREAVMLEEIKQEARAEAEAMAQQMLEDSRMQAEEELSALKEQLQSEMEEEKDRLEREYLDKLETMEPALVDTILNLFQDVLQVELTDYREIVLALCKNTITGMDNPKEISIVVGEENYQELKDNMMSFREILGDEVKLEIVKNMQLQASDCRIETEFGIFECGFDTQLHNLCSRLKVISRQKDKE